MSNQRIPQESNPPPASSDTEVRPSAWRFGEVFEFRRLRTATNNFSEESLIAKGRFWNVYKVRLGGFDKPVAVKRLKVDGAEGKRKFLLEVCILPHMEHPNLVKMIGYTANREWGLVVYEFMARGSLKSHLHDVAPDGEALDWKTRMKIASDVAKGLSYLHQIKPNNVIYGDLKSSNILLDEEFRAKLSDAGLPKFLPEEDRSPASTTMFRSHHGYFPPEYKSTGRFSVESDVYSFGVLLLELITGRPRFDPWNPSFCQTNSFSVNLILRSLERRMLTNPESIAELADPRLKGEFPLSSLRDALEVASKCVEENGSDRPSMKKVVRQLDSLMLQPHQPEASTKGSTGSRISETTALLKHNGVKFL